MCSTESFARAFEPCFATKRAFTAAAQCPLHGARRMAAFCRAGLDVGQQQKFLAALRPATFRAGEYIVRQGDPGDMLYVITEGEVVVTRNVEPDAPAPAAAVLTNDGKEMVITHLYEGHFFGETSLVQDAPRNANVKCLQGEVRCMCMSKDAFRPFLQEVRNACILLAHRLPGRVSADVAGALLPQLSSALRTPCHPFARNFAPLARAGRQVSQHDRRAGREEDGDSA